MSNSYYQKNKPAILAKLKKKRQNLTPEQKEAKKIYAKNYYKKNKERILKQQKKYLLTAAGIASKERASRKYYKTNKDYVYAKNREYYFKRKLAILQGNNLSE